MLAVLDTVEENTDLMIDVIFSCVFNGKTIQLTASYLPEDEDFSVAGLREDVVNLFDGKLNHHNRNGVFLLSNHHMNKGKDPVNWEDAQKAIANKSWDRIRIEIW